MDVEAVEAVDGGGGGGSGDGSSGKATTCAKVWASRKQVGSFRFLDLLVFLGLPPPPLLLLLLLLLAFMVTEMIKMK